MESSENSADLAILVQITGSGGQEMGSVLSHIHKCALGQSESDSNHLGKTKNGLVQGVTPGVHSIGPHVLEGYSQKKTRGDQMFDWFPFDNSPSTPDARNS